MQENNQNTAYLYKLNESTHPRGKDSAVPISNSCNRPWKTVSIDAYTNCMICICDGWLPVPVGEITDFDRLEQIWDNPRAHVIQNDIQQKKYTWCAVSHCGIAQRSYDEPRYQLIFGIDDSCNLECPSCRREKIMHNSGQLYEKKLRAVKHTVDLLNQFEEPIHITLASSGDPLASHIYRPLLHSYRGRPNQTFTLFTNGLLIKKQLDRTAIIDQIREYRISIDAGSADVYHNVRRGGSWAVLMENFEFLQQRRGQARVNLMYVVQRNNYQDIENFVKLCQQFGFHGVLSQLDDWGTWNRTASPTPDAWEIKNGTFLDHDVLNPTHQDHEHCKKILSQIYQGKPPGIFLSPRLTQLVTNE